MKNRWYVDWIVPLLISFVIVTIFSFTTSFLYSYPLMRDSAVFQLIGKNWTEGKIPYRDLWELKGPAVFLPSAIGYWLTESRLGLYIYQILNMTGAFYFIQKIYLLEFDRKCTVLLSCLTASYFVVLYGAGGNTVEEYLLPLLTCSFYCLYKYVNSSFSKGHYELSAGYAFLFGAVLGYSLMSRLTNAVSICTAVAIIWTIQIFYRKWSGFLQSIFSFTTGFLFIILPFMTYFWIKDSLSEMWYGTFLYGLEYAGNSGFDVLSFFGLKHIALKFTNCYFLIITSILILKYNPQRKMIGLFWFVISIVTTLMFLRLNSFGHYYIITLPFTAIVFVEIHKIWQINKARWVRNYSLIVISVYAVLGIAGAINSAWNYITKFHDYRNREMVTYDRIVARLPSDFRKSFIAYNCDAEFYLYYNIPPCYPYYAGQSLIMSYGPSIRKKIQDCFCEGDAHWLVIHGQPKNSWLKKLIASNYEYRFSEANDGGRYSVYERK